MQRLEDIRDFFGRPKAPPTSSSDESSSSSKSKTKKKRVIMLDSDDENADDNPAPKKQHQDVGSSGVTSKGASPKKSVQLTTADDFFGSTTVKQAKKPIDDFKKGSTKSKNANTSSNKGDFKSSHEVSKSDRSEAKQVSPKKNLPIDAEVHRNPKFKEALVQLDNDPMLSLKYDEAQVNVSKKVKSSPKKQTSVEKVGENKSPPTANVDSSAVTSNMVATLGKAEKKESSETSVSSKQLTKTPTLTKTPFLTKTPTLEKAPSVITKTPKTQDVSNKGDKADHSEKKSSSRAAYFAFQNRQGPQNVGSKKLPSGPDDCLVGKSFVLTGVLESFERDDVKSFIERHGGKVVTTVSSKTSYIVIGRDAGESKTSKAEKCGTEKLDEDQLLDLVSKHVKKEVKEEFLPPKMSEQKVDQVLPRGKEKKKSNSPNKLSDNKAKIEDEPMQVKIICSHDMNKNSPKTSLELKKSPKQHVKEETLRETSKSTIFDAMPGSSASATRNAPIDNNPARTLLWVDKYQAKSMKQIIGQQGDKSNARKLSYWLQNWHALFTHKSYRGVPPNKENGLMFRAALLSGVAGIGKTTTATIVCKELGYEMICMNASDTRSQKLLNNVVAETLKSGTLTALMTSSKSVVTSSNHVTGGSNDADLKHVLIMDEVDGMAGNEDRGGMSELINLIKKSKIPVICICNDRQHQKVRSLANYCLDLRFQRPRIEQLKSAMMSMCFKEGLKIQPNALEQLIIGANQDVRQVIHHLQAWFCMQKPLNYDTAKEKATAAKKDQKMGPFDACRASFCFGEERRKLSLGIKLNYFFYDYSMMPLFMQENYLQTNMNRGSNKSTLASISKAADSFVYGDLASKLIRSTNSWSLLPKVGMYTCVIPGELCQGGMGQFVAFPQWLGQNSKRSKNDRLLQVCIKKT